MPGEIVIQFGQPASLNALGLNPRGHVGVPHQRCELRSPIFGQIRRNRRQQCCGWSLRHRPFFHGTGRKLAFIELASQVRNQRFVRHADGHLVGAVLARELRHHIRGLGGLLRGTIHHADAFRRNLADRSLPHLRPQAAMFVELVGNDLRGMDQSRHLIGHLIEHLPRGAVDIHRRQQQDSPVGPALAAANRLQSGRLLVPQVQAIEPQEIPLLGFLQNIPAVVFIKAGQIAAPGHDVAKVEPIRGEVGMVPGQHRSQE